jgi:hypothetical protein
MTTAPRQRGPEATKPPSILDDALDQLVRDGILEEIGWKDGQPLYDLTKKGRAKALADKILEEQGRL